MIPLLLGPTDKSYQNMVGEQILKEAISCRVTEQRNGSYYLEMDYPTECIGKIAPDMQIYCLARPGDWEPFRITEVVTSSTGATKIHANHISYDLCNYPWKGQIADATPVEIMSELFDYVDDSFTAESDIDTIITIETEEPISVKGLLGGVEGSILDMVHGEFRYTGRKVELLEARGTAKGRRVSYGENLSSLGLTTSMEEAFTHLMPYATYVDRNGDTKTVTLITEGSPRGVIAASESDFDPNRMKILSKDFSELFEEPPTWTQLRNAALDWLNVSNMARERQSLSVSYIPIPGDNLELCDTVTIDYPEPIGSHTAKIVETQWDVLEERYTKMTLGALAENFITNYASAADGAQVALNAASLYPMRWRNDIENALGSYVTQSDFATVINPIGTRVYGNSSSVTLSTGTTGTNMDSFSLDPGVWLVIIT